MSDETKFITQLVEGNPPARKPSELRPDEVFETIARLTDGGPSEPQPPKPPLDDACKSIAELFDGGPSAPQSPAPPPDEASAFDVEAMNRDHALLLMGSRRKDEAGWVTRTQAMMDAANEAAKAAEAKNTEAIFKAGGKIYQACLGCHLQYINPATIKPSSRQ